MGKVIRHSICILVTIAFILLSVFVFNGSFFRTIEAFRDFGTSCAIYWFELINVEYTTTATINELPTTAVYDTFVYDWSVYWSAFIDTSNIVWFIVGVIIVNNFRVSRDKHKINYIEIKNKQYIERRPIVTVVCGTMGLRQV